MPGLDVEESKSIGRFLGLLQNEASVPCTQVAAENGAVALAMERGRSSFGRTIERSSKKAVNRPDSHLPHVVQGHT